MTAEGIHRPAYVEVSSSAMAHNISVLRTLVSDAKICAVVKANGYGHGAVVAARAALAGGADSLAVAIVDEGIELRENGFTSEILVLAEIDGAALPVALQYGLTLTIGSLAGAKETVSVASKVGGAHKVHLKVDTGMGRMGVLPHEVEEAIKLLNESEHIEVEGIFTHFPVADGSSEEDRAFTQAQIELFNGIVEELTEANLCPPVRHLSNSAGSIAYPEARQSLVRAGLALYGYAPSEWLVGKLAANGLSLKPVMTIRAQVSAVRRVPAGARPSYGRRRAVEKESIIATVPFGYADGFPRRFFEAGAEVLIRGKRYPLAGMVTMDQLLIDCGQDEIERGDEVILMGSQGAEFISTEEWAERLGTITWEVMCGIGARLPRVATK
jgi:alanine racemase